MREERDNLEQMRALYREKNEHLEKFLEPVTPFEFYREIFRWAALRGKAIMRTRRVTGLR